MLITEHVLKDSATWSEVQHVRATRGDPKTTTGGNKVRQKFIARGTARARRRQRKGGWRRVTAKRQELKPRAGPQEAPQPPAAGSHAWPTECMGGGGQRSSNQRRAEATARLRRAGTSQPATTLRKRHGMQCAPDKNKASGRRKRTREGQRGHRAPAPTQTRFALPPSPQYRSRPLALRPASGSRPPITQTELTAGGDCKGSAGQRRRRSAVRRHAMMRETKRPRTAHRSAPPLNLRPATAVRPPRLLREHSLLESGQAHVPMRGRFRQDTEGAIITCGFSKTS